MIAAFDARGEYIHNITSLWIAAAMPFEGYTALDEYSYCSIPGVQWPDKLWFPEDVIDGDWPKLNIPYWYGTDSWRLLEAKGYTVVSEATGMWMQLDKPVEEGTQLRFEQVRNSQQALIWKEIFLRSFGYLITEAVVMASLHQINYFIAYKNDQPVATAMLFITGKVAGIHSIGVLPEMRKRGFANEIMRFVMNEALRLNCNYAVLHASSMGKDLYLKLGFNEAFFIKNYKVT